MDASLREQLADGRLGPEAMVLRLVSEEYTACLAEFLILDGFPRHVAQVEFAREHFASWFVLHLDITRDMALARLGVRRLCAVCGAVAQSAGQTSECAACGARSWTTRAEDHGAALHRRLESAEGDLGKMLAALAQDAEVARLEGSATPVGLLTQAVSVIL
jgi:adenylate kinase family enzyme